MQELFLTEQLTSKTIPALYTRTTPVLIQAQNNIVLYTSDYIQFNPGQVISINGGPDYPIQSVTFDSLTLTYRIQVLGGIQPMNKTTVTWSIWDCDITVNTIKLDTEDVDVTTDYKVSDIADISTRKDAITRNIVLKGTDVNNRAFGHLFFLGRRASFTFSNRLFFNYAPIRMVDCLLYDTGLPILRGQLLITAIDIGKDGDIYYQATITGSFIGFKNSLGDKKLTDLNLYDMEHTFSALSVLDSWGGNTGAADSVGNSRTYWTDLVTGNPYFKPFAFGTGYVYPMIDYGEKFAQETANTSYARFKMQNYRPALYVREYLNRIVADAGFTYTLLGSPTFIEDFNKLIVPDASEMLTSLQSATAADFTCGNVQLMFQTGTNPTQTFNWLGAFNNNLPGDATGVWSLPIPFTGATNTLVFESDTQPYAKTSVIGTPLANRVQMFIRAKKTVNVSARVRVTGTIYSHAGSGADNQPFFVQLVKRKRPAEGYTETDITTEAVTQFDVIAEQAIQVTPFTVIPINVDFDAPYTSYEQGDQVQVRLVNYRFNNAADINVTSMRLNIPARTGDLYNSEVQVGDTVVPKAPEAIGQMEFVKSLISSLNLYVYPDVNTPKHLYMQSYDDYYALTNALTVASNARDWTTKIDMSNRVNIKTNINLPKEYLFTFKTDSDYLNTTYKNQTGRVYGDFLFSDSLGLTEPKKVELIFSATPPAVIAGLSRMIPIIASGGISLAAKNRFKSNIRLLYYSGVYYDPVPAIASEDFWANNGGPNNNGAWNTDDIFAVEWYALAGNYKFDSYNDIFHPAASKTQPLVPLLDVHYAAPLIYFFTPTDNYLSVPTHYKYFIAQTTELTNPNIHTITLKVRLTEVDINNLDLRVPVFINLGEYGYAYYKIITVTYTNSQTLSTVTLQKLAI